MARPLKVGLMLPATEGQLEGVTPRWSDLLAMATTAEAVGFDSLWMADHFLFNNLRGDEEIEGSWECPTMLAALAAVTSRVELGSMVLCTGFRNPALLAKMADTMEEISGGRMILGIGAGWHEPEYQAMGLPFDHRVSRFEEAVQIIAPLLKTGEVNFQGTWYQAEDCLLRPRGPRPAGPPILIGSVGERMLGLVAQYADIWNAGMSQSENRVEVIAGHLEKVDAACEAAGRDPSTLARSCRLHASTKPASEWKSPYPTLGSSPTEIADSLSRFAEAGIGHVQISIEPRTVAGVEAFAAVLESLDA